MKSLKSFILCLVLLVPLLVSLPVQSAIYNANVKNLHESPGLSPDQVEYAELVSLHSCSVLVAEHPTVVSSELYQDKLQSANGYKCAATATVSPFYVYVINDTIGEAKHSNNSVAYFRGTKESHSQYLQESRYRCRCYAFLTVNLPITEQPYTYRARSRLS